ncbi:AAA family ATPase [Actinocatenispora sera]|uniref:AAA family ATPase n=1 Tax=Actinocatenispora sera TaxID=390989 RepID=UPI0033C4B7E9
MTALPSAQSPPGSRPPATAAEPGRPGSAEPAPVGVILVTGIMAAGKSTVAQLLAEALPRAAHVRGDVFRRMIVRGQITPSPDAPQHALREQLELRYRLSARTADEYAAAGFTAVVQDIVLGADLPRYLERLRTRPRHLVVLAPDPAVVAERERERGKSGYGGGWTPELLDRELRATPRLGRWLDTGGHTPAETVRTILADLPAARID